MIRKLLLWLLDITQRRSKVPLGAYFTTGINKEGQAPIQFIWNKAFIENINSFGYQCTTEEETVELFYVATRPGVKNAETGAQSESHPQLTDDANMLRS